MKCLFNSLPFSIVLLAFVSYCLYEFFIFLACRSFVARIYCTYLFLFCGVHFHFSNGVFWGTEVLDSDKAQFINLTPFTTLFFCSFKKYLFALGTWGILLCFVTKTLLFYLLNIFFQSSGEKVYLFFPYRYSVDPAPFTEMIILSSLHRSVTFVMNHVPVCVCLFLDTLFLSYLSNCTSSTFSFNYFSFVLGHDMYSLSFVLHLKIFFGYSWPFTFPNTF